MTCLLLGRFFLLCRTEQSRFIGKIEGESDEKRLWLYSGNEFPFAAAGQMDSRLALSAAGRNIVCIAHNM
jgi:hypothetical protein